MSESEAQQREFRAALYESLAGGDRSVRDADPLMLLRHLVDEAATVPQVPQSVNDLQLVAQAPDVDAAILEAASRFPNAAAFAEAIYLAHCIGRDPSTALTLFAARRYLEAALVNVAFAELLTDRAAVLDASTFATLWRDPGRFESMLATTEIWRRNYVALYTKQHAIHQQALTNMLDRLETSSTRAEALTRLNTLTRLGPAVAPDALRLFQELSTVRPCPLESAALTNALADSPQCPKCGFALGDSAPQSDARATVQAIERGLSTQQSRLTRQVVGRILARPGRDEDERLDRFIHVVQASDLGGLALVLDDTLVEFLRSFLDAQTDGDALLQLASAFPEVTTANLDAAVSEFRRLLTEGLSTRSRVRLAAGGREHEAGDASGNGTEATRDG